MTERRLSTFQNVALLCAVPFMIRADTNKPAPPIQPVPHTESQPASRENSTIDPETVMIQTEKSLLFYLQELTLESKERPVYRERLFEQQYSDYKNLGKANLGASATPSEINRFAQIAMLYELIEGTNREATDLSVFRENFLKHQAEGLLFDQVIEYYAYKYLRSYFVHSERLDISPENFNQELQIHLKFVTEGNNEYDLPWKFDTHPYKKPIPQQHA